MNRTIRSLIAAVVVVGSAAVALPAHAATSAGHYYSVPYSADLFIDVDSPDGPTVVPATFDDWKQDGFPKPRPASMAYVKYTWDSTIFADATAGRVTFSAYLDYASWTKLGAPTPRTDRLAADSTVYQYRGSDELFVSAGVAFADEPGQHKLTFSEYRHLGYPAVVGPQEEPYRKLSWSDSIVGRDLYTGEVARIDFATWTYLAQPTPQVVASFDGDRYCQAAGSPDVRYSGLAAPDGVTLTFGQWVAAGSPRPTTC